MYMYIIHTHTHLFTQGKHELLQLTKVMCMGGLHEDQG